MARKQSELPGTRRDDEPPPPKSIKRLDDALEEWERAKGKQTKAAQTTKEKRDAAQAILVEENLQFYVYEDLEGVEQRFFRKETVGKAKEKRQKRRPEADGDEE